MRTVLLCALCALALSIAGPGSAATPACDAAWNAYNDMKDHSRMDPSQYPLTVEGAAVRSACGKDALPAPAGADSPPRPRVRRPRASGAR